MLRSQPAMSLWGWLAGRPGWLLGFSIGTVELAHKGPGTILPSTVSQRNPGPQDRMQEPRY